MEFLVLRETWQQHAPKSHNYGLSQWPMLLAYYEELLSGRYHGKGILSRKLYLVLGEEELLLWEWQK